MDEPAGVGVGWCSVGEETGASLGDPRGLPEGSEAQVWPASGNGGEDEGLGEPSGMKAGNFRLRWSLTICVGTGLVLPTGAPARPELLLRGGAWHHAVRTGTEGT